MRAGNRDVSSANIGQVRETYTVIILCSFLLAGILMRAQAV